MKFWLATGLATFLIIQTPQFGNWENKIYWVSSEVIDSPLNPFEESFHEIRRTELFIA